MVIFFGPTSSGKSVQGQILASQMGWRWLSMGQLLRDANDVELVKTMHKGELVSNEKTYKIIGNALYKVPDVSDVILDGFPRNIEQAKWLFDNHLLHKNTIGLTIVLEVPRAELIHRLELRGRTDDTPEAINERLTNYRKEIYPILDYFTEHGIRIAHIDGTGTVDQVHNRITKEITACN